MDPFSLVLSASLVFPEKPTYIKPDPPVIQQKITLGGPCGCGVTCQCAVKPIVKAIAQPAPVMIPPAVLWRATDIHGQAWTHADRVFLDQWILRRNNSLPSRKDEYILQRTAIPPVYYGTQCSGGRCR